ncbi:50S ribosome-binding GTPase [Oryctes borbonicus]|uniref:Large subunit GTPase 1 homolog n=1 Tax=Oryctes borbonicus TaxID=1629725 RepID=A0A0T6AWR5_9SCAR|nr:50S ribosome-binding GTPase [Oryctes borbonicus]
MGKKNKTSLGRSLIKDRFSNHQRRKMVDNSMLHTTEMEDGYNWGRLNLQSVTEESSFQEFLSTAELAGTEFQAEKLNIKFINPKANIGLLTQEEKAKFFEEFQRNKDVMKIPRRPHWTSDITADELHEKERDSFLQWRKSLSILQEEKGLLLTPYEKNIEFWKQLWRVLERSDIVVQIVDARNPLLFWCEDLSKYVKEISEAKSNLILLNKADYLSQNQRDKWAHYFDSMGMQAAFFSATLASNENVEDIIEKKPDLVHIKEKIQELEKSVEKTADSLAKVLNNIDKFIHTKIPDISTLPGNTQNNTADGVNETNSPIMKNSSKILTRMELISYFKSLHSEQKVTSGITTVGLVGYPNVGKSSTINSLLSMKKVSVSATPGKTKHFQTLYLDDELLLCDCPGLVMPSFVYTKGEMIINGILPVDQMKDHVPPINLISSLIPRHVIEDKYGILLPVPLEGEDESRCPTAEEILNTYGFTRGFMTANGQPDNPRAARYIIKDFINGKLLYVYPPPGINDDEFHNWPPQKLSSNKIPIPREIRATKFNKMTTEELDRSFFNSNMHGVHTKGSKIGPSICGYSRPEDEKPWKEFNKHANKKKKEKLRRLYAHLDQH